MTGAVLLYLPRNPGFPADDASNIAVLQSATQAHIVQINYRAGEKAQFPTPVHDVLAGYDWVVSNILPKRAITRAGRSEHVGRIAVCGELLGGGLATMLAVTECRAGEPGIVAAAVSNPIVDWVGLDEISGNASTPDQKLEAQSLMKQRAALFCKPEHYYDPFTSPMLFFRSAGAEVPGHMEDMAMDDMGELSRLERLEYLREHGVIADLANPDTLEGPITILKQRKSTRRYPSKALGLRLPAFHLSSGAASVLSNSASELADQLRKSYERQIESGVFRTMFKASEAVSAEALLEEQEHVGFGLWDGTDAGRGRMQQAAAWIATRLSV